MKDKPPSANPLSTAFIAFIVAISFTFIPLVTAQANDFKTNPRTPYAKEFLQACDGQGWFISAIQDILVKQGKSINTLSSDSDLADITAIGLAEQGISGKIPPAIGKLKNLRYIYLGKNQLSGELPVEVFSLKRLENVDLSENELTGSIPENISNLKELKMLLLWGNKFSGELPDSIGELTNLVNLDVAKNTFSSNIPSSIGSLTKLKFLALSENQFSGVLPDLGNLTNLEIILAWGNKISGEIPSSIGSLSALKVIDVSENQFTGLFPASLLGLENLTKLNLANNGFTGTIPDVSGLKNLEILDLAGNIYVGDAPDSLLKLSENGAKVDISGNYMSGPNALKIADNTDNFIDGLLSAQWQLTSWGYQQIELGHAADVSVLGLRAYRVNNHGMWRGALRLKPNDYTVELVDGKDAASVSIEKDAGGVYRVKTLKDISFKNPVSIRVYITENGDSKYSSTIMTVGTDPMPNGSGGSYGTTPASPPTVSGTPSPTPVQGLSDANRLKAAKYINGYPDGTFRPDASMTREEFAQILWALYHDEKEKADLSKLFSDVNKDRWSATAIAFVKQKGWMIGYPDGSFKPGNTLTRAEIATVVSQIKPLGAGTSGKLVTFPDTVNHWAKTFISNVAQCEIMVGYPDGAFKPDKPITRAEVVAVMNRQLGGSPKTAAEKSALNGKKNPFTDMARSHWAYYEIMEAAQ